MIMLVTSLEYESGTTASWIGRNRFKNQGVWNMYFGAVYWATGCLKGQETRVNAGVTGGEKVVAMVVMIIGGGLCAPLCAPPSLPMHDADLLSGTQICTSLAMS